VALLQIIPRGTRAWPLFEFPSQKGISVYTNNIHSPGSFHPSFFIMQQEACRIHVITCSFTKPNLIKNNCGFNMISIQVSFWSNSTTTM
jgi:hypothetical protein